MWEKVSSENLSHWLHHSMIANGEFNCRFSVVIEEKALFTSWAGAWAELNGARPDLQAQSRDIKHPQDDTASTYLFVNYRKITMENAMIIETCCVTVNFEMALKSQRRLVFALLVSISAVLSLPNGFTASSYTLNNAFRNIEYKTMKSSNSKWIILVNSTASHNSTKENLSLRHVSFTSKSSRQ